MAYVEVLCPKCNGSVGTAGKTKQGIQKYRCRDRQCNNHFRLEYTYNGRKPGIDAQILEMSINGSGIRDISRVLKVSKQKVSDTLKRVKKT